MNEVKQDEIYHKLFTEATYLLNIHVDNKPELTDDVIRRKANIYAVKNTVKTWRKQYKRKNNE